MAALQSCMNNPELDISTEIFRIFEEITGHNYGPFEPGEWLCLNLKNFTVGRAYPYQGEYRIVPLRPDFDMMEVIDSKVASESV